MEISCTDINVCILHTCSEENTCDRKSDTFMHLDFHLGTCIPCYPLIIIPDYNRVKYVFPCNIANVCKWPKVKNELIEKKVKEAEKSADGQITQQREEKKRGKTESILGAAAVHCVRHSLTHSLCSHNCSLSVLCVS